MSWNDINQIETKIDAIAVTQTGMTTNGTIVEDTSTGTPKTSAPASSASANTFGSWVQHDASTSAASYICSVTVQTADTTAKSVCIEVGTGIESSESTKIRFSFNSGAAAVQPFTYIVPVPILVAASTRISVRASDSYAGAITYNVGVQYYQTP